ncbi:MAG: succinate dehydrogenase, hydrophobic membrane anchor protein [Janthinobacterium lividum]
MENNLRTELARAKGLGPAKTGVIHWWHQRLTSLIMLPLLIWLMFFIRANSMNDFDIVIKNTGKPLNLVAIILFVTCAFYHGMLGMRVIIEDYVSNIGMRNLLIVLLQLFCILTVISMLVALILVTI